jgi:integrase
MAGTMASTRLTRDDEAVRDLMPPAKHKRVVPDKVLPRLLLVVHPSGSKSWALRTYPRPGVPSTRRIGTWPAMLVQEARLKAALFDPEKEAKRDSSSGAGEIAGADTAGAGTVANTVTAIAKDFMLRHVEHKKLRTHNEIQRVLDRYILPSWGERPLTEIRRADVTKLVDRVADEHGQRQAEVVFARVRKLMSWHAARSDDYNSPIVAGMRRPQRRARSRVLNDDEIRALWKIAPEFGAFGALCQVLLLTGQRLAKVAAMRHEDVVTEKGETVWIIRTEKGEKGNAGTLPLPPMLRRIIAAQPEIAGRPFVFASAKYQSSHKRELDKRLKAELLERNGLVLKPWVIHDLRRTARSLMSRAKVPREHAERVLGHALPGVEGVYDQYSYQTEKGEALAKLAGLVAKIVRPNPVKDRLIAKIRRSNHDSNHGGPAACRN